MEIVSKGFMLLSLALITLALIRHLTIALTMIYVNLKTDKALVEKGYVEQIRSPNFYTAFTFANLLNLIQTARFDKKVVSSDVFTIDFRGIKPRYRIFFDKL